MPNRSKTSTPNDTPPVADTRGGAPAKRRRAAAPQRRAEAHDEGVLESLGKAVSEPVRDAADPEADEKPD